MAIFIAGLSLFYLSVDLWRATHSGSRQPQAVNAVLCFWLRVIIVWGFVSLATFVLLWPAMWVDPVGTLRQMLAETFGKVEEGHLVYFFGQPTLDPGPWFYPYVIPFRLTPVVLIGCVFSLGWLGSSFIAKKTSRPPTLHASILLWAFVLTLLLFGTFSPKKQDRYLLPLFPILDLLAAMGWLGFINLLIDLALKSNRSILSPRFTSHVPRSTLLIALLLLLHLLPTLTYYPYYLTYFNPLLGGPTRAAETTLLGWGEGMEQVAAYLNAKPNAAHLYVASTPSQTLLPYFAGTGENFYTNDIAFRADYVVLYLAQIQRRAPSAEIVNYFLGQKPEKTIVIHGVDYALIYPGPKWILTAVPPGATLVNFGLDSVMRLAGYEINPTDPSVSHASHRSGPISNASTSLRTTPPALQPPSGSTFQPSNPSAPLRTSPPVLQSSNPSTPRSFGSAQNKSPISKLQVTFYWHALAPMADNYTISVRLLAADGQLLVQQDQWPLNGLLPTSQWRQGDYVADTHHLHLPTGSPVPTSIEIVVYNAAANQTLGPPITINNE
jgi:hypothetical protein